MVSKIDPGSGAISVVPGGNESNGLTKTEEQLKVKQTIAQILENELIRQTKEKISLEQIIKDMQKEGIFEVQMDFDVMKYSNLEKLDHSC